MQAPLVNGLRAASRRQALAQTRPNLVASSFRAHVRWEQRRNAWSPMDWFRKTMIPKVREKDSEKEVEEAREKAKESGEASVFEYEDAAVIPKPDVAPVKLARELLPVEKDLEHRGSTKTFKISHRKLNKLANQISGKPIDSAILQMIFSEKRASGRIKSMLAQAKGSAIARGMNPERLVVAEAWVNKGPGGKAHKVAEIKGRGRIGIQSRYSAKMVVKLREGLTFEEKRQKECELKLKRVVSAGLNREDVPLRNPSSQWAW